MKESKILLLITALTTAAMLLTIGAVIEAGPDAITKTPFAQAANGFWSLTGNAGTTAGVNFIGTTDDKPLELHVNNGRALRIEPSGTSNQPNIIGRSRFNVAADGVTGATISSGGSEFLDGNSSVPGRNEVSGDFGTVGGGVSNSATGEGATVGGGKDNTAQGIHSTVGGGIGNRTDSRFSTVGGGFINTASGHGSTIGGGIENISSSDESTISGGFGNRAIGPGAAVGGGSDNIASGQVSTIAGGVRNQTFDGFGSAVSGGDSNIASGDFSVVPGGLNNTAAGNHSLAAGNQAMANHNGTFVWADAANEDFTSTGENQFLIRASGGVGIGTNSPNQMLVVGDPFASSLPGKRVTIGNQSGLSGVNLGEDQNQRAFILWVANNNYLELGTRNDGATYGNTLVVRDGKVGVGASSPTERLTVNGNVLADDFVRRSSKRWKTNIQPIEGALEQVQGLRGVSHDWKANGQHDIGLVAEEVGKVVPEVVVYEADGKTAAAVDYAGLVPLLIEAVKEQQQALEEKDAALAKLEARIEALEEATGMEKKEARRHWLGLNTSTISPIWGWLMARCC
jgi:hypothetical protein